MWEGVGSSLDEANDPYNRKGGERQCRRKDEDEDEDSGAQSSLKWSVNSLAQATQLLKQWMEQEHRRENPGGREMVQKNPALLTSSNNGSPPKSCCLKKKGSFYDHKREASFLFFIGNSISTYIQYCINYKWVDNYNANINS